MSNLRGRLSPYGLSDDVKSLFDRGGQDRFWTLNTDSVLVEISYGRCDSRWGWTIKPGGRIKHVAPAMRSDNGITGTCEVGMYMVLTSLSRACGMTTDELIDLLEEEKAIKAMARLGV